MNYPLGKVLKIRSIREQTAMARTLRAQQKVREAEACLLAQKKRFIECRNAFCHKEELLVENARKRRISIGEFETLQEELFGMKCIEMKSRHDVDAAAENVKGAKSTAERIKADYLVVLKRKKKIEEHYRLWLDVETVSREKAAEEELDELAIQCKL